MISATSENWLELDGLATPSVILDLHYKLTIMGSVEPDSFINTLIGTTRSYIVSGLLLQSTFRYRLWEKFGYNSVKDFCWKVLGRSVHYCKRNIQAALVALELIIAGHETLPTCQAQAEELAHLVKSLIPGNPHIRKPGQEKEVSEAWTKVLEFSAEKNAPVTASFVRSIVRPDDEEKPALKKISVDRETYEALEVEAAKQGISCSEYLKQLIRGRTTENTEPVSPDAELAWQEDLEQLVSEHDSVEHDSVEVMEDNRLMSIPDAGTKSLSGNAIADGVQTHSLANKKGLWALKEKQAPAFLDS